MAVQRKKSANELWDQMMRIGSTATARAERLWRMGGYLLDDGYEGASEKMHAKGDRQYARAEKAASIYNRYMDNINKTKSGAKAVEERTKGRRDFGNNRKYARSTYMGLSKG